MCTRRMPVDTCVKIAIPATRDHLPRGDTLAPNRQCPLVAGTTVVEQRSFAIVGLASNRWIQLMLLADVPNSSELQ